MERNQRLVVGVNYEPVFKSRGQPVEKIFGCWAQNILSENCGGIVIIMIIIWSGDWKMDISWEIPEQHAMLW